MATTSTSSSKHTPGPWIPYSEEGPRGKEFRHSVCRVPLTDGGVIDWDRDDFEHVCVCEAIGKTEAHAEANARLIAAAPELLTALRSMLASVDDIYIAENPRTFDAARAAIAKAEGR